MELATDKSSRIAVPTGSQQKMQAKDVEQSHNAETENIFYQAKLTMGSTNDPLEHEADAMAGRIMRLPSQSFIHRKDLNGAVEEVLQRDPSSSTIPSFIQTKSSENPSQTTEAVSESIQSSKGSGFTMDNRTKSFMSERFNNDFNGVGIHTNSNAVKLSHELNAKAFTVGNDIYFNQGQYQPETSEGKFLLAHELTHVLQHGGTLKRQAATSGVTTTPPSVLSASEAAERVQLRLFDSDGFFATHRQILEQFRIDMMALGWFAGDKTASTPLVSVSSVAQQGIQAAASAAASKGIEFVLKSLGGIAATGGGMVAGGLIGILASEIIRLNSYKPTITQIGAKPAHQIFIESVQDMIRGSHEVTRDKWTQEREELISSLGVTGLSDYADKIRTATVYGHNSYYAELVAAFLPFAESRSLELETPNAVFTGEGRGFKLFVGNATYVSTINGGDIYVQLFANGSYGLNVVKTVVPELRTGVVAQLNSQSKLFSTLPKKKLIIETDTPIGPAQIVYNTLTAGFDIPESPHFSREFCRQVYKTKFPDAGLDHSRGASNGLTEQQFLGAIQVYAFVLGLPLNKMNFST